MPFIVLIILNKEIKIKKVFYDKHYALEEKAQLCIDVAKSEDKFVNKDPKNIFSEHTYTP